MDIEESKGMPDFEHDIEPYLYHRIPADSRDLAETISKLRQETRWAADCAVTARNLAVQNAALMKKVMLGAGGLVGAFMLERLLEFLIHK
jgi:hypothetical protein